MTEDSAEIRAAREDVVERHLRAEEAADVPGVLATFAPGRASYLGDTLGGELNGDLAVGEMLTLGLTALSDLRIETVHLHHATDAVIAELRLESTHTGDFDGVAPTGRRISYHLCAVFRFEGTDLWQEAVYYDLAGIKAQLTA